MYVIACRRSWRLERSFNRTTIRKNWPDFCRKNEENRYQIHLWIVNFCGPKMLPYCIIYASNSLFFIVWFSTGMSCLGFHVQYIWIVWNQNVLVENKLRLFICQGLEKLSLSSLCYCKRQIPVPDIFCLTLLLLMFFLNYREPLELINYQITLLTAYATVNLLTSKCRVEFELLKKKQWISSIRYTLLKCALSTITEKWAFNPTPLLKFQVQPILNWNFS